MSLVEFAPIADVLAALGVMVTVAVLAWEIRQTRKQTELTNWRELLETLVAYKGQTHDAEFADMVERGHADYDGLSPSDKRRFGLYLEQGIHIYGNFAKHNDALPRKLVGLEDALTNYFIEMLTSPGGAAWWAENRPMGHFMPSTYAMVDAYIARGRQDTDRRK
ncbi:hypothetical protein N8I71_16715 [Roseibacterium sp. SDUM158016]|jgi:hypothetical protein|uniref:hypothetical protein n=1 Tax=Roseicyclus sediminis TaxID=2980997 RepID=UPI0021CFA0A3|nr:hypothetical protein [Roseibacterium sp. SDUM158016]MCU4654484.1 hypothetical protein [Roseibacterium sp. SDUM158016]